MRIVVTGAGVVSAIGIGKDESLEALTTGRSGIAPVRYLDTTLKTLPVGEAKKSNEELCSMLKVPFSTSRTTTLGILALKEALEDANLALSDLPYTALVSGTTVGCMDKSEQKFFLGESLSTFGNCGESTEQMADYFGRFGYVTTCSTACSSAANAFVLGSKLILDGHYDRVIVGGSECLSKYHFNGFRSLMILDGKPCRPFDCSHAGLNLGEGAAFVVLEAEDSAKERGAKAYAVLSGWGNACDAFHQTATSPEGSGAQLAMRKALALAHLEPSQIDYINAHGTGTANNDRSESTAIRAVFTDHIPILSSTKSMTGHATSAGGGIEMVICLLSLLHGLVPPNLGFSLPEEGGLSPVSVPQKDVKLRHILCNSFGFGGNDTALVLSAIDSGVRPDYPCARHGVFLKCKLEYSQIPAEEMPKISPMVRRRLSKLMLRALSVSLSVLERCGTSMPDAIVTGTDYGSQSETLDFITQIKESGEATLAPTHFMQSTHNTIGSLIAIHLGCHGYNNTLSQGHKSLRDAMRDAYLGIRLGEISNALVGVHDELWDLNTSFFLDNSPEGALCELNWQNLDAICGDYCR